MLKPRKYPRFTYFNLKNSFPLIFFSPLFSLSLSIGIEILRFHALTRYQHGVDGVWLRYRQPTRPCREHAEGTSDALTGLIPDLESHSSSPTKSLAFTRWKTHSTGRTPQIVLSEEDTKKWESCRQAFSTFEFSVEEEDKILGKAFGLLHSPYWGEEREKIVPKFEQIDAILDYLRGLGLSDNDISKMLKKFPEVVGCSLENELKANIQILEKQWGIKGKSLKNLLLRNPKVLGYIVDCKGDCMALCTRCWVRF